MAFTRLIHTLLYVVTIHTYLILLPLVLYCIVLYSIKRDWPPCKVVFRVGNQNTKCDKQQQSSSNVFVFKEKSEHT